MERPRTTSVPHRSPAAHRRSPALSPALWPAVLVLGACRLVDPRPPIYEPRELPSGVVVVERVIPYEQGLPYARRGDRVTVHYRALLPDGTQVDSSFDRGTPVVFELGSGEVPTGLELGLEGLRVRGQRSILVPADLAYGIEGVPGLVPPNTPVRFEVELVSLRRTAAAEGATDED
jgi:FKBP-type peptidyl-prolyl cis-trans isomerase FkpA